MTRIRNSGFPIREVREIRGEKSSPKGVVLTDCSAKKEGWDVADRLIYSPGRWQKLIDQKIHELLSMVLVFYCG